MEKNSKVENLKNYLNKIKNDKTFNDKLEVNEINKNSKKFKGFIDYSQSFDGSIIVVHKIRDYYMIKFDNHKECVFQIELSKEVLEEFAKDIMRALHDE